MAGGDARAGTSEEEAEWCTSQYLRAHRAPRQPQPVYLGGVPARGMGFPGKGLWLGAPPFF